MSYPQGGYQQQPWQQGGGQGGGQGGYGGGYGGAQGGGQGGGQGGYGGGYNYPAQTSGNPATAIIAGILGVAAAVLLAIAAFKMINEIPSGAQLPSEYTIVLILLFAAAAICLIGAIITFVRKVAGAFVLLIGAVVVVAAILLQPPLLSSAFGQDVPFGDFFQSLFKFEDTVSTCEAIALICAPLLLIFSVIPPTLNWLRGPAAQAYGGYPQQPQQQGGYQGW